jgi:hypothetical protein
VCLIVAIEAPGGEREELERAARAASAKGLCVTVDHAVRWPWARQRALRASISEDAACACSLLSDDADWNAGVWAMRPEVLEPLGRTLEVLAEQGPSVLAVQALWVGERSTEEIRVSGSELASLARRSQLGTRTRYVVERAVQQ